MQQSAFSANRLVLRMESSRRASGPRRYCVQAKAVAIRAAIRGATSGESSRADHSTDAGTCDGARTVLGDDELPAAGIERSGRGVDGDLYLIARAKVAAQCQRR
jgi:hypothetical protein